MSELSMENIDKSKLETLSDQLASLKKEYQEAGKKAMQELLESVFDEYPKLEKMSWTQYTPWFNDGDECIFSVGEIYFIENKELANDDTIRAYDWDEYNEDAGVYSYWGYTGYNGKYNEMREKIPYTDVGRFLNKNEDALKELLGDHILVEVTREGIQTTEYEHD